MQIEILTHPDRETLLKNIPEWLEQNDFVIVNINFFFDTINEHFTVAICYYE